MSVSVEWDDKANGILRLDFDSYWTFDEYEKAIQECARLAQSIEGRTAMLHNVPVNIHLPSNYLSGMRRYLTQAHGVKAHTIMVVTPNVFTRTIINTLIKIYRSDKLMSAPTLEEARQVCRERAQQLQHNEQRT